MSESTIKRFSKMCRFCLIESNDLQMISEVSSIYIFGVITGIEVTNAYVLPQKICSSCVCIFQTFLAFIEKSKENINKLKTLYEQVLHQENEIDESLNEEYMLRTKFKEKETIVKEKCSRLKNNRHKKSKASENTEVGLKCERCKMKFKTEGLLAEHIRINNCIYEESTTNFIRNNKGSKKCSVPKVIICRNCKFVFKTQADLSIHCKEGFTCQPVDYKCSECNKFFTKRHKLNNHMRSHTKEAPFECTQCEKTFRFQQNLKRHILIHKGIKKFKCEDCGKAFSRAHVLNEHRNIHTGHNPYICDYCGKGFKRYANHFIHVYRHKLLNGEIDQTEDKKLYLQLQCNFCNKIFASRGGLENHLTLHQDEPREKKFLCTECGKGFNTNAQLESHMRTHTGDRPFECSQCGKKFKQKSAYSNHKLVHSGEKPYQCKECERYFTQSGHLKVHMRVHSGEKPFACNFCGKKFALKSNLKVHTRTHTGEKPYVCSVCNKGYYDSTSLKKHMKCHGVGLPAYGHVESKIEPLEIIYCSNTENHNEDILPKQMPS